MIGRTSQTGLLRSFTIGADKEPAAVHIKGDGNIVGDGNTVIHTHKVVKKVVVQARPGEVHITGEQVVKVKDMVRQIVELEKHVKRKPKGYPQVYGALKRHCKAGQINLIELDQYDRAVKYLQGWIGRLLSMPSAPRNFPGWREVRIRKIMANAVKNGLKERLYDHLESRYGHRSVKALEDEDLERVYRLVLSWKKSSR